MATVLSSRAARQPRSPSPSKPVLEKCWHCQTPVPSDRKSDPHLCPGCIELGRNSAVHDAFSTVGAITRGDGPLFNGLDDAGKLKLLGEIMAAASNEQLIALAAAAADTIAARMGSVDEPAPAERARIEADDEGSWHPDITLAGRGIGFEAA